MKLSFNLQHFTFFCTGALTIMLIDVYVFSDFTAPVITATTASITLLIALKTAAKVNKWLDDKIKDKKFEQAHNFYEDLHRLTVSIALLKSYLDALRPIQPQKYILNDGDLINDLAIAKEKLDESNRLLTEIAIYENYFIGLKIKLTKNEAHSKFYSYAVKIVKHAECCLAAYNNIIDTKENSTIPHATYIYHQQNQISLHKKGVKYYHDTFNYISTGLARIEFSNMFDLKGG
ncbi:hypothetical protein AB6T85_21720 [Erwinia sp. ACCC 02193]|jgi:hypothetical protein|uniref:SLATT domain-containing protein n=1 Tax=Erwinia aeris TaxID=3239803 RepID=A0ABV4EDN5_9GAMM